MITKNELKYYSSLLKKKYRTGEKKFIIEGKRLVEEGLKSDYECEAVLHTPEFIKNNPDFSTWLGTDFRTVEISASEFKRISDTENPQGVAAILHIPQNKPVPDLEHSPVVALENLADPGNLGTIIRNCDWFGIPQIILSKDCAELYNPKVLRASMGSVFHINISESADFYGTISDSGRKNYEIICADTAGVNIYKFKSSGKQLLVLSNEAAGPTKKILSLSDTKVTIPKFGNAESLNVASASAVIISELIRKQQYPNQKNQ